MLRVKLNLIEWVEVFRIIAEFPGFDNRFTQNTELTLGLLGIFCRLLILFQNLLFRKFRNTFRVSDSLDPYQARQNVQTVCKGYQQTTLVGKDLSRIVIAYPLFIRLSTDKNVLIFLQACT